MSDWFKNALAISDFNIPNPEALAALDPGEVAEIKAALGFNAEHMPCHTVNGGDRGLFYFKTSAGKVACDFFAEYVPEAKRRGIHVMVYFNVHWLNAEFGEANPDFVQYFENGEPINNLYGRGMAPCVNSPSYREYAFQVLKDLALYDIDGVFLDGPVFFNQTCYCEHCKAKFIARTGQDPPAWGDRSNSLWHEFIEFRYDSITDFLHDARSTLLSAKPGAVIYMNGQGLWPGWPNGRDNRRLVEFQDILGAEGGFIGGKLDALPLWKPAMSAKLLETQANGTPTVVFIAGADKGWDSYLLTPNETKLLYADTLANGANPWYGIYYAEHASPGAKAAGEMNRFIKEYGKYLNNTVSIANVALVWSAATADYYRATVPVTDFTPEGSDTPPPIAGDHSGSFKGWFDALVRGHFIFDVLDDIAIRDKKILSRYDAVILPNCACISNDSVEALKAYADTGGTVVGTFETGRYDEWGDATAEHRLAGLFGISTDWKAFGPLELDYVSITGESSVSNGLSSKLLPAPRFGLETSLTTGTAPAYYLGKMPARYHDLPPVSKYPAIVLNEYGKGKGIYFPGTIDENYAEFHNPDLERLMQQSVSMHSARLVELTNATRSVEVTIRKQEKAKRLMVHIVNFTGEMARPIQQIVPLSDVRVSLASSLTNANKVKLLWSGKERPLVEEDGRKVFTVPRLDIYEVAVIE